MAYDYSKFDKSIDTEGLKKDLVDIENNTNSGDRDEVPVGDYETKIIKMELVASSKGDPMAQVWFKVLEGEYKDRYIFMNQVLTKGFQIHKMNEFLRSLDSGVDVMFDTYHQYGNMLLEIHEKIDDQLEYLLSYTKDKNGYSVFNIKEIFEIE